MENPIRFVPGSGASWYEFVPGAVSYGDALIDAALAGGWLLIVDNSTENTTVADWLSTRIAGNVWMGIADVAVEGTWRHMAGPRAGETISFTAWAPGRGSNSGEDFAWLSVGSFDPAQPTRTWGDGTRVDQNASRGYVVEYILPGNFNVGQATQGLGQGSSTFGYFEVGNAASGRVEIFATALTVSNAASGSSVNVGQNSNGDGTLRVHDGSTLVVSGMPPASFVSPIAYGNASISVGRNSGAIGDLDISGAGTAVTLSGYQANIEVGRSTGKGMLSLTDGARLSLAGGAGLGQGRVVYDEYFDAGAAMQLGRDGGVAEVLISGEGTRLDMSGASGEATIRVARNLGTAVMRIEDGADVLLSNDYLAGQADWSSAATIHVGRGAGAVGRLEIAGHGTTVELRAHGTNIMVGRVDSGAYQDTLGAGTGSATISDGARVKLVAIPDPDRITGEKSVVGGRVASGGIDFDGATSRVEIADPGTSRLDLSSALTLEIFLDGRPYDVTASSIALVRKGNAWSVTLDTKGTATTADDQLVFVAGTSTGATLSVAASQIFDGFEHSVAMVYDGVAKTFRVLRDGVQIANQTGITGGAIAANNDPIQIGGNGSAGFSGTIDEVRLWSKARSNDAVSAYVLTDPVTSADRAAHLVGQWKFDETIGTAVADSSGNSFAGLIVGPATRASVNRLDGDGGDASSSYVAVGRGQGANGDVVISGSGTRLELDGAQSSVDIGTTGGQGRMLLAGGAVLTLDSGPSPLLADYWSGTTVFIGRGRGYLDGIASHGSLEIRDPGTLFDATGHQVSLYVGRDRTELGSLGGTGELVVAGGATLRLSSAGAPDRIVLENPDHWSGVQINVGRGPGGSGTALFQGEGTRVELSGHESFFSVSREGGSGALTIADGAILRMTSVPESERGAFATAATLDIGRETGSVGSVVVAGGAGIVLDGSDPTIRIGVHGGNGELILRSGAFVSITGGSPTTTTNILVGESTERTSATTYTPGRGHLSVSGAGTRVEIDGAGADSLSVLSIGRVGDGSVIVADGGRVDLGAASVVTLAERSTSSALLTVRGDGSVLATQGLLIAGVAGPSWSPVPVFGSFDPENGVASGGRATIHVEAGGRIEAPRAYLAGGALLDGDGTFAGVLRNMGGIVDPGREIGVLTIEGDYWQSGTGTLRLDLSGAGSDALLISGRARLESGLIDFDRNSSAEIGSRIVVARAAGGIELGTGLQIQDLPAGYVVRVEEGGAALVLTTLSADTRAPLLRSAAAELDAAGTHVTLAFDEGLAPANSLVGRFSVTVGGQPVPVSGVLVAGDRVTLSLASAVAAGSSAVASYADAGGDQGTGVLQDLAGNDVASFSGIVAARAPASTLPPDITAPRLVSVPGSDGAGGVLPTGNLVLGFDEAILRGSGTIVLKTATGAVVESFDAASSVRVAVSGNTLSVDPSAKLASGEVYTIGIPDGAIRDLAGNVFAGLPAQRISVVDVVAPVATGATLSSARNVLAVRFDEELNAASVAPGSIVVRVGGTAVATTGASVAGTTAILTLHDAVAAGAEVTVSYTDPTGDQAGGVIEDRAGNDAASFLLTASSAPSFFFGASRYEFVPGRIAYADALNAAAAQGGWLATIESAEENAAFVAWLSKLTAGNVWLGISDAAVEATWVHAAGPSRGTATAYAAWVPGEGVGGGGSQGSEDYAQIQLASGEAQGRWVDSLADASANAGYVIEYAGGTLQSNPALTGLGSGNNTLTFGYYEIGSGTAAGVALQGAALNITSAASGSTLNVGTNTGGRGELHLLDGATFSVTGQPPATTASPYAWGGAALGIGRSQGSVGELSLSSATTMGSLRGYSTDINVGISGGIGSLDLSGGSRLVFDAGAGVSDARANFDEYFAASAYMQIGRNGGSGTLRIEGEDTAFDISAVSVSEIRVGMGSPGTPGSGLFRVSDGADVHLGADPQIGIADWFAASSIVVGRGLGSSGRLEIAGEGTNVDLEGHVARMNIARPDNGNYYDILGAGSGHVAVSDGAMLRLTAIPDPDKVTGEKAVAGLVRSGAIDFDGATSFVEIADAGTTRLDVSSGMTLEIFLDGKPYETDSPQVVIAKKGSAWSVVLDTRGTATLVDDLLTFAAGTGTGATISVAASQFFDGFVHVAAMTYDGVARTFRVFRDGSQLASKTVAGGDIAANDASILIGGDGTAGFSGAIDEVRLWNKARSNDALNVYTFLDAQTSTERAANLVGLWKFDEASGSSFLDSSGGSASGVARGAVTRTSLGRMDDDGGDYSSASISVGRGVGASGALVVSDPNTRVELTGHEASMSIGTSGGTGSMIVENGSGVLVSAVSAPVMADYWSGATITVGRDRGYANDIQSDGELVIRGAGTRVEVTGHQAIVVAGRDRSDIGVAGGEGRIVLEDGAQLRLDAEGAADRITTSNPDHWSGAEFVLGRNAKSLGSATIDGADTRLDLSGHEVVVRIGQGGGEGSLLLSGGAAVALTSASEAERSAYSSGASVQVGRDVGSHGVLSIAGAGTVFSIEGSDPGIDVGRRGGYGEIHVAEGALLSLTGGTAGSVLNLNLGDAIARATGETHAYGSGTMTVSGRGTRVVLDGAADVNVTVLDIGRLGTGSLTIEDGGSVHLAERSIVGIASSSGSAGELVVRGAGSVLSSDGFVAAGVMRSDVDAPIFEAILPWAREASGGNGHIIVEDGGRIAAPQLFLNGASLLEGDGAFEGTLRNLGGIVDPGKGIGEFLIVGDYWQTGSGVLRLDLSGVASDALRVTGVAQFDAGTIDFDVASTADLPSTVIVAHAAGGIALAGGVEVRDLPAGYRLELGEGGKSLVLTNTGVPHADTRSPLLVPGGAQLDSSGARATLTFDEGLASGPIAAGSFTVSSAGQAIVVTEAMVSGSTVTLVLAKAVAPGSSAVVSYADRPGDQVFGGLQDKAGNDVASVSATTNTRVVAPDTSAPRLLSSTPADGTGGFALASNLTFVFDEAITRGTGTIALRTAVGVTVESFSAASSSRLTFAGASLTIDPSNSLSSGTAYTLDMPAGAIRDAAGNAFAGLANYDFVAADVGAPSLASASVSRSGTAVILRFTEALEPATVGPGNFVVSVGGQVAATTGGIVSGNTAVLLLHQAAAVGGVVSVTYSDPVGDQVAGIVQDRSGNDAAGFTLTVSRAASPPPVVTSQSGQVTGGLGTGDNSFTTGYFEAGNGTAGNVLLQGSSLAVTSAASGSTINIGTNTGGDGELKLVDGANLSITGQPPASVASGYAWGGAFLGIGRSAGSVGEVSLDGASTIATMRGYSATIEVGRDRGVGTLDLTGGSRLVVSGGAGISDARGIFDDIVPSSIVNIGRNGGSGTVRLHGEGTSLDLAGVNTAEIRVGLGTVGTPGYGHLVVENGADLHLGTNFASGIGDWFSASSILVGRGFGSEGIVVIDGAGTTVDLEGHIARFNVARPDNSLYLDTLGSGQGAVSITGGAVVNLTAVPDADKVTGEKGTSGQSRSGGIDFDGSTSFVEILDPGTSRLDMSTGMTLEIFLDGKSYSGDAAPMVLAKKGSAWSVTLDTRGTADLTDDLLTFSAEGLVAGAPGIPHSAGTGALVSVAAGQFFDGFAHVAAMVYDGIAKTFRVFRDGAQLASQPNIAGGAIAANNDPIQIGGDGAAGFSGAIDEVRLWSKARSNDALSGYTLLDAATSAEAGSALVGQWKFDEATGSAIADSSGNGFGGTIRGGATRTTVGRWDDDGGDYSGAYIEVGRGRLAEGQFRISGGETQVGLKGHEAVFTIGSMGGIGLAEVSQGARLSLASAPAAVMSDYWSGSLIQIGRARGFLDDTESHGDLVIKDAGTRVEIAGHQAAIVVGRDRAEIGIAGGKGELALESGATLRLAADGAADRITTTNADHWSGAELTFGRNLGSAGSGRIDGAGTRLDMSGHETMLRIGSGGGSGALEVGGGATVRLTSAAEVERSAYYSGANLTVGRDPGSVGRLDVHGQGTSIALDGSNPGLHIGRRGADGSVDIRDGATVSLAGGDLGTVLSLNVGDLFARGATETYAYGRGKLTVTGVGSRVDLDGAAHANVTALNIGRYGSGSVTIEDGGRITLAERSVVSLAATEGSFGELVVRGEGALLSGGGMLTAGVLRSDSDAPTYESIAPATRPASGGNARITVDTGGRIAVPDIYLNGAALLEGDGTIEGVLRNLGGIVDPGADVGALLVAGDYRQTGTGVLRLDLAAYGADQLRVTGVAQIDAGAIDFDFSSPLGLASMIVVARASGGITLSSAVEIRDLPTGYSLNVAEGGTALVLSRTVIANDAQISVSGPSAPVAEGNLGSASLTFTVTRNGDTSGEASVAWAVAGSGANPATAGDFVGGVLPAGVVSFGPGETSRSIIVAVAGDTAVEADEGMLLTLSVPAGATLGTASASATIRNDDAAVVVSGPSAPVAEGNSGNTAVTFTVARSGDTSGVASASWSVAGSGSTPATGGDFTGGTFPSGTVSFAAGEASKAIVVNIAGDTTIEPDEGFTLTLSAAQNASLDTGSAAATIANDDADTRAPVLSSGGVQFSSSGNQVTLTFDEVLASGSIGAAGFSVASGGQGIPVTGVTLSGSAVTLNLSSPIVTGVSATVTYSDAAGNQTAGVLQDLAGNDVASFSASAVRSAAGVSGMTYHWKSHALLSGVSISAAGDGKPPGGSSLFEIRGLTVNANGDATFDIYANAGEGIENFGFELRVGDNTAVTWSGTDFADWTILPSTTPGQLLVGAFGTSPLTGTVKLGSVIADLPAGADWVRVDVVAAEIGTATISAFSESATRMLTGNAGTYALTDIADDMVTMAISRGTSDAGNAITSQDALAALRIAVGRNPNTDPDGTGPLQPKMLSPYQLIASDVNGDGRVTSADALAILKMAVRRTDAPAQEWIFVREDADFWTEESNSVSINRNNVSYAKGPHGMPAGGGQDFDFIGVLKGDVNGSWTPTGGGVQILGQDYFAALSQTMGVPLDFWG